MRIFAPAFAVGACAVQRAASLPSSALLAALTLACVLFLLASRYSRAWRCVPPFLLASAALLAGYDWAAWRAQMRLSTVLPEALEQRDVRLSGRVEGLPEPADDGVRFVLRVEAVHSALPAGVAAARFPARVRLSWTSAYRRGSVVPALEAGQRWTLTVRLKRPHGNANFGGFDTEAWLLRRGIRATGHVRTGQPAVAADGISPPDATLFAARAWIDRVRGGIARRIDAVLPQRPHAGVVTALAIGYQGGITRADWLRFSRTGTNHLVAVSGLHVGLVAGFAALLGGGLWRRGVWRGRALPLRWPAPRLGAVCALLAAAWFVALAGFGVPAQRAFWMLAVVCAAAFAGRAPAPSRVLAWALLAVVVADPWAVSAAGFWLSFGAVAAIAFATTSTARAVTPHDAAVPAAATAAAALPASPRHGPARSPAGPARRAWRRAWPHLAAGLGGAARVQIAVTVALVPAGASLFGQVPLLGPLANAVAIPWVSFLVVPAVLAGVVLPAPCDALAFHAAHTLIAWLGRALDVLAAPGWAMLNVAAPDVPTLAAALLGVAWGLGPRGLPLQRLAPLLCAPLFLYRPAPPGSGEFRVTLLDVGQGMAALVETRGHRMLYDTGPPMGRTDAGERLIVPSLRVQGVTTLDTLVVSHDHDDHYGGARTVLTQMTTRQLLASLPPAQPLWMTARDGGARVTRCRRGASWRWDGVTFEVLWPADPDAGAAPNGMSCVIRVANARHTLLLAGDIEAPQEAAMLRAATPLDATILLAPHHGSRTSSTDAFVAAVAPAHVVFQMGYLNRYRHPHPQVVARYARQGAQSYRSDRDGAVRFETHGARLDVMAYRRNLRRYWMAAWPRTASDAS
ncbi:DNA internalization-related competence protein ComEC/Rec2 [Robbsia sp. Bb-Pol-6]|uniref:DNA internalization-related competence protein ComEC/Rec2 n=1 Tax=Robbsia betulipollinis TaxID=2981849 RepID=A0ABT3ZNP0_9BURK|nr:DNA internalization-related competence protein ComEC/Rec2 [Robbsia betulipollinis]MCY0387870.1 DNA internalization-related competence protein ComEC/Rec2 [Robbsia betulipollinis]